MNIVQTKQDEDEIEVTAYSGTLELINEECEKYSGSSLTFKQYFDHFNGEGTLTLGLNEVSDKKLTFEWTSTATLLARLFSLATEFGAEIEFVPKLESDYSLSGIVCNVYREHDDSYQGIGRDRTDQNLRYGKDITGITREVDITSLYTMIYPLGKDDMTISSLSERKVYDSDGKLAYWKPANNPFIYAPLARDSYPSNMQVKNDGYTLKRYEYDTDNKETLYGQALSQLKKLSQPSCTYEVSGYIEGSIGDTFTVIDEAFEPTLYLSARITEQEVSFTDSTKNKTTFDNIVELQSQISSSITEQMEKLIEKNLKWSVKIVADATVFKNTPIKSTLTAWVFKGSERVDYSKLTEAGYQVKWSYGETTGTGESFTVDSTEKVVSVTAEIEEVTA